MRKSQTGDETCGRSADRPAERPARGLRDVLKRVFTSISEDALSLIAAGVAFYVFLSLLMLAVIGLPAYLQFLHLPGWLDVIIRIVCWLVMLSAMVVGLGAIYTVAGSRRSPKMRWVSPGAIVATVGWLIASLAFSFYIGHFGNYNKTYGSIAAIIILMLWFWISVFVVLLGGELNAELERLTRKDSTVGEPRGLGQQEPVAADDVADAP